jgi:CHAT domain-containing protein
MEYARSRTLLEILTEEPGGPRDRLADLRRKNQAMKREILRRTEELTALPASADRDSATTSVLRALHELRRKHDELRTAIGRELPDADAATATAPLTLREVQAMLDPGSAVIEYYVTRNELVVFLITRNAVRAVTRPESETHLAAKVKLLRATLGNEARNSRGPRGGMPEERPWEPSAAALTAALLEPLRGDPLLKGIDRLVVVPHKFLHYVPFQALTTGLAGGRPRFLVEDFMVSYAPSASVLKHCVDRDRGRRETLLALANPMPRGLGGRELLYAEDEVRTLKRRFGDGAVVRIGREATETAVKEEAGDYDLLHIATHFTVNARDPLRSALDFAPSTRDDGQLEVREVMDLGVDANLVVLNGCFTAAGGGPVDRLPESDDWVGLTRAFIYAGAPSVVATLWPVNDRSASRFMDRFYELLPEMGKSEALARAQRDMIAGSVPGAGECADPYHWAPFVLIGSAQ